LKIAFRRWPEADSDICVEMERTGKADVAVTPNIAVGSVLASDELFRDYLAGINSRDYSLACRRIAGGPVAPGHG
jgi:hypothetical protein